MADSIQYAPGPAFGADVEKQGERWTLILVRDLRHAPETVWSALTDPAQLSEWAPFDVDRALDTPGVAQLTWTGTANTQTVQVTRAEPSRFLEVGEMRWELEAVGSGTRLRLWHAIDRRFVAWGAAGWHIAFDVLAGLLDQRPVGRLAGPGAMAHDGWRRLCAEYAARFGADLPGGQSKS